MSNKLVKFLPLFSALWLGFEKMKLLSTILFLICNAEIKYLQVYSYRAWQSKQGSPWFFATFLFLGDSILQRRQVILHPTLVYLRNFSLKKNAIEASLFIPAFIFSYTYKRWIHCSVLSRLRRERHMMTTWHLSTFLASSFQSSVFTRTSRTGVLPKFVSLWRADFSFLFSLLWAAFLPSLAENALVKMSLYVNRSQDHKEKNFSCFPRNQMCGGSTIGLKWQRSLCFALGTMRWCVKHTKE